MMVTDQVKVHQIHRHRKESKVLNYIVYSMVLVLIDIKILHQFYNSIHFQENVIENEIEIENVNQEIEVIEVIVKENVNVTEV